MIRKWLPLYVACIIVPKLPFPNILNLQSPIFLILEKKCPFLSGVSADIVPILGDFNPNDLFDDDFLQYGGGVDDDDGVGIKLLIAVDFLYNFSVLGVCNNENEPTLPLLASIELISPQDLSILLLFFKQTLADVVVVVFFVIFFLFLPSLIFSSFFDATIPCNCLDFDLVILKFTK